MCCHSSRKNLCSALILCHFDYSCSSWYAGLTKCIKKKLQIAQNKVIRFINSVGPRSRVTADTLGELNLLNVENRVKQLRLNHVHKIFYDLCPTYLKENCVPFKRCASILYKVQLLFLLSSSLSKLGSIYIYLYRNCRLEFSL